ncbi:MAG: signal peptide peptidase SppA [Planctomycetota bacterium]|jgi:protease-4
MDFDENENRGEPSGAQPSGPGPQPAPLGPAVTPIRKKHTGWRIFLGIFIGLSVLANIFLFFMLIGVLAFVATGPKGVFAEEVVQEGPRTSKIAIITIGGIIDSRQSQDMYKQLKEAKKDRRIKGLIIRVDSPGGLVSSSDQIYNEIRKWREETEKPVVAFMESIAASGGYYASVACDKIVAEPTVITGSVGVILSYLVVQELLEEKLGIEPVVVKSGERKDWPSMFETPDEEQLQYLDDKLISPAYERFVAIVAEGRASLTVDDVKRLADGSIYGADEALAEKLIDAIGYLDDAIEQVKSLAGIEEAQVVEYHKPFSLAGFLSSRSKGMLNIDRATLHEFSTPQLLYLWSPYE